MKLFKGLVVYGAFSCCVIANAQTFKSLVPGNSGIFPTDVKYQPGSELANQRGILQLPNNKGSLTPIFDLSVLQFETDALKFYHIRC